MKNLIKLGFISIILILTSCEKGSDNENFKCALISNGLLNSNVEQVKIEIDKLTIDLIPEATANDQIGQRAILNQLIQRLNSQCATIEARFQCYACFYSLPAQSEIAILFDSLGVNAERILRISTPDDEQLTLIGLH